jgi:signal transduction histidine kinase
VTNDGTFIGFVCCTGKGARRQDLGFENAVFSDTDDAVLEAIVQAAGPHLEVLVAEERRQRALERLTHELKVPIVAIQGAADFMKHTNGVKQFFHYDYLGDICSWMELMNRLIDNADAMRHSTEGMKIEPEKTRLLSGVIAPAVRQVTLLLKERTFSSRNIRYDKEGLGKMPDMWIDRNQFQQVMFNLFTNAIKYAYHEPDAFSVEVGVREHGSEFHILFRDWGVGLEAGTEELIFQEGFRGEKSVEMNVGGQGVGLWVVRNAVERHMGSIEVTNLFLPTEFTISLPYWLASRPPL